MDKKITHISHIDYLRGVAILLVVLIHTSQSIDTLSGTGKTMLKFGQMGVQLFFLISAYTMCLSSDRRLAEDRKNFKFYIRRYFRIAPMYYSGIIIYSIADLIKNYNVSGVFYFDNFYAPINIAANFLFVNGIYMPANNTVVPGGWSIGTEMLFYLIFPMLFVLFKKIEKKLIFISMMPLLAAIIAYVLQLLITKVTHKEVTINSFVYYNILFQLPVFFTGIFLYFFEKNFMITISSKWLLLIGGISLSLTFFIIVNKQPAVILPFVAGLFFFCLYFISKKYKNIQFYIVRRIGQLSFSIYIMHFLFAWYLTSFLEGIFLNKLNAMLGLIIAYSITMTLSVIVAVLTEKFIEKPGIELGKKIIKYIR